MKTFYFVMTTILAILILPCLSLLGFAKTFMLNLIVLIHGYIFIVLSSLCDQFECEYQLRVMGQVHPNTALIHM